MFWGIVVKVFLGPDKGQDSSERNKIRVTQTLQKKQEVMALVVLRLLTMEKPICASLLANCAQPRS